MLSAFLILSVLLSLTFVALTPVIKFFTLPINAVTFGLFNFVISCIYIYFFDFVIPGLDVFDGSIGPFITYDIQIPEIKMSFWGYNHLRFIVNNFIK